MIKDKANKVPKPIKEKMQPIKVALIDDGVTLGHLANTKLITKGWFPGSPTPEHGSMDLWYYSEKGHGTEMAKLVQFGCPFVNIFVGKLDTRRLVYDTVAKSAVKVRPTEFRQIINRIAELTFFATRQFTTPWPRESTLSP